MSDIVFPTLASPNWKMTRTPVWHTLVQTSASGKRSRVGLSSAPIYKWTLKNGVLQAGDSIADLQAIELLFNQMNGMNDSFLWNDPESSSIPNLSNLSLVSGVYFRVAFLADEADFDRLCNQIWELGKITFQQVRT